MENVNPISILKWQFKLTWQLAEIHFSVLTDEMCLWEPSKNSWNVRFKNDKWRPDFSEVEPSPIPTVTIGWLTWQMLWWWQGAVNAVDGKPIPQFGEVHWPGQADLVREQLMILKDQWIERLDLIEKTDSTKLITHLWPERTPLWQTVAWVNSELMKNISEIGYVRFLYDGR